MVENDGIESFSQTFSQCSIGEEVFRIDSQTLDPSIFEQNTPDIEFLCITNEAQINCSQKENLIGFVKGEAITQSDIDSDDDTSSIDLLKNIKNIENTLTSLSPSDNSINEKCSSENEILNLSINRDSKSFIEDNLSGEINYINSPIFVVTEEYVSTTYNVESQSSISEEYNKVNQTQNYENLKVMYNDKVEVTHEKFKKINVETEKIYNYIEIKTKLPKRGRPLIVNHRTPNFNKIEDPGKLKYVERRFKNNIASQYSRIKSNIKGKQMKEEYKKLEETNRELIREQQKLKRCKLKLLKELERRNIDVPVNYYVEDSID